MVNGYDKRVLVGVGLQEPARTPTDNGYGEWVLVGVGLLVVPCLCGVIPFAVWQRQITYLQWWPKD